MPQQIITRASNKNRHPGAPDMPAQRRSHEAVQAERASKKVVAATAWKQRKEDIRRAAEIEDQLQTKTKTQHASFHNPTVGVANTMNPPRPSVPVTDNANSAVPAQALKRRLPSSWQDDTYDGGDTEKDEPDLPITGSDDEAMSCGDGPIKRPAKVTRHLIQAARAGGGNQATIASRTPAAKRKLQREGVTFFSSSAAKKVKVDTPSGLTPSYQHTHKKSQPGDNQQECPTEAEHREDQYHGVNPPEGGVTVAFGGLEDEREKLAGTQNAVGPRGSTTKIVPNAPQERLRNTTLTSESTTIQAIAPKIHPSHQNLPEGSATAFSRMFIPLLRLYCGTLQNPWMLPDRFIDKLQALWDEFMLDWPHAFDEDDDVYRLCMQKIYEWRAHIGRAGIDAVEATWASDPKYENPDERKAYIEFALGPSLPFMYGQLENLGNNTYKVSKSFLSPLVLQTLACHFKDIASVSDDATYFGAIGDGMPRGALVLAVTAVERALSMYSTRVKEVPGKRSQASFSDFAWGMKTALYTRSISRVGQKKFYKIINMAREYCNAAVQPRQVQGSQRLGALAEEGDELDDRALIAVSSDVEAEEDGEEPTA